MINIIAQTWIVIFGATAIFLVSRLDKWKKWGYICGMIAQPAWYVTAYLGEQWGILAISIFYTYSWGQGIYNYWVKEEV